MAFLDWVANTGTYVFKALLLNRDVSEFDKEELIGVSEDYIEEFVYETNENSRKLRKKYWRFLHENPDCTDNINTFEYWLDRYELHFGKEYQNFLSENPDYIDNKERFENWLYLEFKLKMTFDYYDDDKVKNEDNDEDVDEDNDETYGQFLHRTGIEDTEQNLEKFISGYTADQF